MVGQAEDAVAQCPSKNTSPSTQDVMERPVPIGTIIPEADSFTVFRLADNSEVSIAIAEESGIVPAGKVRQALQVIVTRGADSPADREACLRRQRLAVQLSHWLNDCARRFPPAAERDLNADLKYAVYTVQKVKKWR